MLKPVLHIIALGLGRLDKLSLETYRLLRNSSIVYVFSFSHPAVADLIQEGIPCLELFPGSDLAQNKTDLEFILKRIARELANVPPVERIALALPGSPISESRLVKGLEDLLADRYQVNHGNLAEDGSLRRLVSIMEELRSPGGCPWDQEQTHDTLRKYLIEETYEVIEAIDTKNMNNFCEELGDLLLQIIFHARIAEENNTFSLSDVLKGISDKMLRRHPHVFGSVRVKSSEEVLVNWEAIKKTEKGTSDKGDAKGGIFFNIPKGLPALQMAEDAQKKASKVGFDWNDFEGPLAKVHEELAELEKEIGVNQRVEEELGDLLFSIVNLSRFLGVNAEESLRQGTRKFQERFNKMAELIQKERRLIDQLSLEEMDFYWNEVKNEEKYGTFGLF